MGFYRFQGRGVKFEGCRALSLGLRAKKRFFFASFVVRGMWGAEGFCGLKAQTLKPKTLIKPKMLTPKAENPKTLNPRCDIVTGHEGRRSGPNTSDLLRAESRHESQSS